MKKQFFNLIEIALAMAIIAIGLSSLMVLFPVGLTASNAAVAANNIPDISSRLIAEIKARMCYTTSYTDHFFNNAFFAKAQAKAEDTATEVASLPAAEISFHPDKGVLYYVKSNPNSENADFSAAARFWYEPPEAMSYSADGSSYPPDVAANTHYHVKLWVEVSWPLDLPYAARKQEGNIRLFRVDLVHPNLGGNQ